MVKKELEIRAAYLTTKEKTHPRYLSTGRIINNARSDNFVFYLFEIDAKSEIAEKVTRTIIGKLEKNARKSDNYDQEYLEKSLEDINISLEQLAKLGEKLWIGRLNAAIGVVKENTLNLTSTGRIAGYLFRKGRISSLTESTPTNPLPQKTFSDLTSGPLTESDKIILGSTELYNNFSLDRLRRLAENQDSNNYIIELLKLLKHKKVLNVNAIALETAQQSSRDSEQLPNFYILDEKEETLLHKVHQKVYPMSKRFTEESGRFLQKNGQKLYSQSKILLGNTKKNWNTKVKPKTKTLLENSAPAILKTYKNVTQKIEPGIKSIRQNDHLKIKTHLYSRPSDKQAFLVLTNAFSIFKTYASFALKKENRKYLFFVLFLCFLSLGYFKIKANNNIQSEKNKNEKIIALFPEAQEAFDKAKENIALGKVTGTNELQNALTLAEKASASPENKEKGLALIKQIQAEIDKQTGTTRFYNLSPSFSLGSKIQTAILIDSDYYLINQDGKIYDLNVNNNESSLVGSIGKDNGEIIDLTYSENDDKIYILTSKHKVTAFNKDTKTIEQVAAADSKDWENASAIAAYSSSLYLINDDIGEIVKHNKQEIGFSKGSSYGESKKTNLKNARSIAIDGNVYALSNEAQVYKFSKGSLDSDFSIQNIPSPGNIIKNPTKLMIDSNYMYILDQESNRILRFDKSGQFKNQYSVNDIKIESFSINTKIQKGWFVSGESIYQFDL